jgi:16S rRNA (adenine(1408)-N(1))-methyltransferase
MEVIRGKQNLIIDEKHFGNLVSGYSSILMDIGTGDGHFVKHAAIQKPDRLVIGIDACRENLCDISRKAPPNALFVIANALNLPGELTDLADHITINFPWGSLLSGLLTGDAALISGLLRIMRPQSSFEINLNSGALAEQGWPLEEGAERIFRVLKKSGLHCNKPPMPLTAKDLHSYPSTWAKRLAFGRDPHGKFMRGHKR